MIANINDKVHCDGYLKHEIIIIKYSFPNRIIIRQKYSGTLRQCYIPNRKNGRILLGLLKIAFDRKLTFIVKLLLLQDKRIQLLRMEYIIKLV